MVRNGEIERQKYVERKSNEWDTEIGTKEGEIETERKMWQKKIVKNKIEK